MASLQHSELGKQSDYPENYDASLLFPITRTDNRATLGLTQELPFQGADIWNAYEISWLDDNGKPHVAIIEFILPCTTPNLIESKSFKLYLNSFNQSKFTDQTDVLTTMKHDLSEAAGGDISLSCYSANRNAPCTVSLTGTCIDELDISITDYQPNAQLLTTHNNEVRETLISHLLKSNCPVTGQPDWASVQFTYSGKQIDHKNLLKYIISYRQHNEFHEQCVERMFVDIMQHCQPTELTIYARYTRRGGLDINPFRSNTSKLPSNQRSFRQ